MRLYQRSADRRPDPPPLETDDRTTVLVGTVLWAVLALVGLVLHGRLADEGRGWWVWTAVAGALLGLVGLRYVSRRSGRRARPGD